MHTVWGRMFHARVSVSVSLCVRACVRFSDSRAAEEKGRLGSEHPDARRVVRTRGHLRRRPVRSKGVHPS